MSEPGLTEFLRARLAEDERDARKLAESDHRPVLCLATTVNHPERLLLEVEAKRRIVDLHTGPQFGRPDAHLCQDAMIADDWCETLRALALPYADHDDYDERWRP